MKATGNTTSGTGLWNSPNSGATNESGFTGLPGGERNNDGTFNDIDYDGYWWSSTEGNTSNAWGRYLSYDGSNVNRDYGNKRDGFSCRCLRD
jgi:uncharacterized protein (TIGR02145 family)